MTDIESQEDEIEALQSIFTEEEFHSLKDNNSIKGQFNAFVSVPEGYTVVYREFKSLKDDRSSNDSSEKSGENDIFEKTMNVQYLPPVQLNFELPSDYPSKSPPFFTILCPWLTFFQLKKLSQQLFRMWTENKGFVVLYSWAQFLKDECLTFLKLDKSLDVTVIESRNNRRVRMLNNMERHEQRNNLPKVQAEKDTTEGASKTNEEAFTIIDLSSVSDKLKEEQALLVKLSLYDSNPTKNSERGDVISPEDEIVINEMIAFDRSEEIKRSLYCAGSSAKPSSDVKAEKNNEIKPGPSHQGQLFKRNRQANPKEKKSRSTPLRKNGTPYRLQVTYPSEPLWNIIGNYNKMRKRRDFDYQIFCCAVCFEEKIGSQCMELESCNHVFCRECLTSFLNVCITEGKVKQLSCPETNCDSELLQSEIRSLVSPELFTKYDTLLLATTLDTLNVMYCPRKFCQYPVTCDNDTMALCPQCHYCFCPFCKMVYHGVEPCRFKLDSEETKNLIKEYQNCSEARKAELEKRYGRKHLQQLVDTSLSQSWISTNSKQCPNCNSSIERTYGCNKMVCLRCKTAFCWLCLEILDSMDPYRHFQAGRCAGKLYLGMTVEVGIDELDIDDDMDEDVIFIEDDFLDAADFEYFGQNVGMHRYHNGIFYL